MNITKVITVKNNIYELDKIYKVLEQIAQENHFPSDIINDLYLCMDEIFSNIVRYAYDDNKEHNIDFLYEYDKNLKKLKIIFVDCGKEFNPLELQEPNFSINLLERELGGLGVFIVTNIMNNVAYERCGNKNKLMMTKDIT